MYHYVCDHLGTPLELRDARGRVVWSAMLRSYGQVHHVDTAGINQPLRFQEQYHDAESGLYYNRHRYYDPGVGRYLSPDPIGLKGGINQYQYVPNPLKYIDPLGLCKYSFDRQHVLDNINASRNARASSNFKNFNEWPPNRGVLGESSEFTLLPGTRIDRYGSEYGTFLSPEGTPYRARSLKPGTDGKTYSVYEVMEPITVDAGEVAPWFGYEGGGTQYELRNRAIDLINNGSLERR
ncbi:glycohydrolase toxin TNT-related protein [Enterobacter soli]|uniref:glycohydrolase toxin TNT-related protein n=1 Tax=Enterobacter soli TaxID=885040 RepID=UPI0035E3C378